ncbi:MAG: hypothetical protein WCJ03_06535 [Bacteroidales bacterium]
MKSINILTYNINHNKTTVFFDLLKNIVQNYKVHIIVLQESSGIDITKTLNNFTEVAYLANKEQKWVRIFIKSKIGLDYKNTASYMFNKMICTIITLNGKTVFTLMGAHFYSLFGKSTTEQCMKNYEVPRLIQEYEIIAKSEKTVLVGDLNYRMHDIALHNHSFLNATNSKKIIRHFGKRDLGRGNSAKYFYNPMWNILGDYDHSTKSETVPGSFYWIADDAEKYYWNLIDGLLLRPEIMDNVPINKIKIITEVKDSGTGLTKPLLKDTLINNKDSFIDKTHSDHLPIVFTLKI